MLLRTIIIRYKFHNCPTQRREYHKERDKIDAPTTSRRANDWCNINLEGFKTMENTHILWKPGYRNQWTSLWFLQHEKSNHQHTTHDQWIRQRTAAMLIGGITVTDKCSSIYLALLLGYFVTGRCRNQIFAKIQRHDGCKKVVWAKTRLNFTLVNFIVIENLIDS